MCWALEREEKALEPKLPQNPQLIVFTHWSSSLVIVPFLPISSVLLPAKTWTPIATLLFFLLTVQTSQNIESLLHRNCPSGSASCVCPQCSPYCSLCKDAPNKCLWNWLPDLRVGGYSIMLRAQNLSPGRVGSSLCLSGHEDQSSMEIFFNHLLNPRLLPRQAMVPLATTKQMSTPIKEVHPVDEETNS